MNVEQLAVYSAFGGGLAMAFGNAVGTRFGRDISRYGALALMVGVFALVALSMSTG